MIRFTAVSQPGLVFAGPNFKSKLMRSIFLLLILFTIINAGAQSGPAQTSEPRIPGPTGASHTILRGWPAGNEPSVRTGTGADTSKKRVSIRLRCGLSPVTTQPLLLLDGVVVDTSTFKKINPNQIEHIEIMKGDKALALFGSQGNAGVIIITTKVLQPFQFVARDSADERVVPFASLTFQLLRDTAVKFYYRADSAGKVNAKDLVIGENYRLKVESFGYERYEAEFAAVAKRSTNNILLKRYYRICEPVIVVGYPIITCRVTMTCVNTITKCEMTNVTSFSDSMQVIGVDQPCQGLIYPNPAARGQFVKLQHKFEERQSLQLMVSDGNGRTVLRQVIQASKTNSLTGFATNAGWKAGVYFVRLADARSKTSHQYKLIIQ